MPNITYKIVVHEITQDLDEAPATAVATLLTREVFSMSVPALDLNAVFAACQPPKPRRTRRSKIASLASA